MKEYYTDKWVTIYHGDCREILPQLDVKVDLVLTDPPYNIGANYSDNGNDDKDDYWGWFKGIIGLCRDKSAITIFTHKVDALRHITDWDWVGIWNKPYSSGTRIGNSNIVPHCEPIFMYGIHKLGVHSKYTSDVFTQNPTGQGQAKGNHGREIAKVAVSGHRFMKPVELITNLIEIYSKTIILDPFLGSGTTCYCAKKINRYSIGIEIEEKYCEIAAKRCSQEVMELGL